MTAIADEFGGPIPVGPFALIGDEEIGRGVVETIGSHRSNAVLMRAHGVFALGETPRDAVKCAVMCEEAAKTVHLARALGPVEELDADSVDALHHRYQNVYGQH
jgi:L-ribulose-5-phosphate 4-epimerase